MSLSPEATGTPCRISSPWCRAKPPTDVSPAAPDGPRDMGQDWKPAKESKRNGAKIRLFFLPSRRFPGNSLSSWGKWWCSVRKYKISCNISKVFVFFEWDAIKHYKHYIHLTLLNSSTFSNFLPCIKSMFLLGCMTIFPLAEPSLPHTEAQTLPFLPACRNSGWLWEQSFVPVPPDLCQGTHCVPSPAGMASRGLSDWSKLEQFSSFTDTNPKVSLSRVHSPLFPSSVQVCLFLVCPFPFTSSCDIPLIFY